MYNKNSIINFIQKYYLNGLVGAAKLTSNGGNLETIFKNPSGNLRGQLTLNGIKLPDGEIGVFNTSKLLKMLSILGPEIDVQYNGVRQEDGSIISFDMQDEKGRKALFGASALSIIESDGKTGMIKTNDIELNLTAEIVEDLLKGFAADTTTGDAQTFTLVKNDDGQLVAVFGYTSGSKTDKIEIPLIGAEVDEDFDEEEMIFSGKEVKEVLSVNKGFGSAVLKVSSAKGVMTLIFQEKEEDFTSTYWIIKNR